MTAESLKPFMNLPMDAMKKKSNIPFLCFGILVVFSFILLSLLQVRNNNRK